MTLNYDMTNISEKLDNYMLNKQNKQKYNDVLRNTRRKRRKK